MNNPKVARAPRRVVVVDESALAKRIGDRIREGRDRRGMTQRELAGARYSGQYVSSLERGAVKPSMAALNYLAERLQISIRDLLDPPTEPWSRVEADVMLASGELAKAEELYTQLLASAPTRVARAEALLGLAEALCRQNRGRDAISRASEAIELFEANGRVVSGAWASYWLASAQYQTDNITEARALLEALLLRVRAGLEVESGFKLRLLTSLASVAGWSGDHLAALSYLAEGRDLIEGLDPRVQAAYYYSLAQNYKQAGDLEAAVRSGLRSLALYEGLGAQLEVSVLHNHLALTHMKLGNTTRADEFARLAARETDALGDRRARAWVTETRAEIALATGNADEAVALAEQALELNEESTSPETYLSAVLTMARAHRAGGRDAEATTFYERAASAAQDSSSAARRRLILAEFAEYLSEAGDEKRALAMYRDAVQ